MFSCSCPVFLLSWQMATFRGGDVGILFSFRINQKYFIHFRLYAMNTVMNYTIRDILLMDDDALNIASQHNIKCNAASKNCQL